MLLRVQDLNIQFDTLRGPLHAVDRLSFQVDRGETLGIVGESGCGKSITSLAMMGLLPATAKVSAASMSFSGRELLSMPESERRSLRGADMAMIFQDPMTSLNPAYTIGFQLIEALKTHQRGGGRDLNTRARELLNHVGIPDAADRLNSYPHHLSGGMCQRVMIAMAIACQPKLLIADEPTTALDVTIQAQILELLKSLQREYKMGLILITHDIGVVAEMADRILVMYAGQCVETGAAADVIQRPRHPYTHALLQALPGAQEHLPPRTRLKSIPGLVPDLVHRPRGCQMHPRCEFAQDRCRSAEPSVITLGAQSAKCFTPLTDGRPSL